MGRSVLWAQRVWEAAATNYRRPRFLASLSPLEPKNKVLKTRPPIAGKRDSVGMGKSWASMVFQRSTGASAMQLDPRPMDLRM